MEVVLPVSELITMELPQCMTVARIKNLEITLTNCLFVHNLLASTLGVENDEGVSIETANGGHLAAVLLDDLHKWRTAVVLVRDGIGRVLEARTRSHK